MPKNNILTGKTRLLAIFGWPLAYTLSPKIQSKALAKAGIDARYLALPSSDAKSFLKLARGLQSSPHFMGGNITNPFKGEALKLGKPTSAAKAIGAGNTLVRGKKGWEVHNTDAPGFLAALGEKGAQIKGREAWVLGAGGASRAIIYALAAAGASRITVLARRLSQAKQGAALAGSRGRGLALTPDVFASMKDSCLVVNTLPGAGLGQSWGSHLPKLKRGLAVDISYVPPRTPFLMQAKAQGWQTLNGLGMLKHQAHFAFRLWHPGLKALSLVSA